MESTEPRPKSQDSAKIRENPTNEPVETNSEESIGLHRDSPNLHITRNAQESQSGDMEETDEILEAILNCIQEWTESEEGDQTGVLFQIQRSTTRLNTCDDLSCSKCVDDIQYVCKQSSCSEVVSQRLLELGMLELFQQIWTQFFPRFLAQQVSTPPAPITSFNMQMCMSMYFSSGAVQNMTDASVEVCRKVFQLNLYLNVINFLKDDQLESERQKGRLTKYLCYTIRGLIGILYNVVQTVHEARECFREQGIVELLQRFLMNTNDSLSYQAMLLLARVLNEEENSIMGSCKKLFKFLETELATAIDNVDHVSSECYRLNEILEAINILAVNDENKSEIVKSGILSSYAKLLETTNDAKEQILAAQGIWSLALSCAEEIKTNTDCVESLQKVREITDHDEVRNQVTGALSALGFTIGIQKVSSMGESTDKRSTAQIRDLPVFISCQQQTNKHIAYEIRNRLPDNGYNYWIDVDKICTDQVDCNEQKVTKRKEKVTGSQRDERLGPGDATVPHFTPAVRGIFSWTKEDVREWLEKHNFLHLIKWFENYDGRLLLQFKSRLDKAPQLIAPSFIAAHSVEDYLSLDNALEEL